MNGEPHSRTWSAPRIGIPNLDSTNGHTNSGYYWSPHAGKVFAIQTGPLKVTWKARGYVSALPADYIDPTTGATNYFLNGGNYFRLYTVSYLVSGSPVKPPRTMFWTEKGFRNLGKPVAVPPGRVGDLFIAYSANFPKTVITPYVGPGDTDPAAGSGSGSFQDYRTLWYDKDQGNILAYNYEGRVFMELLGDARPDNQTREPLGFEIVDVSKNPSPIDVTGELGERVLPPAPGSVSDLSAEPVLQTGAPNFAFQKFRAGNSVLELYATRETANLNDYLVHWLELGDVGLRWPKYLGRYKLIWPTDVSRYSHFVRPLVATDAEARVTAIALPTINAPTLEFQDAFDFPRGKLTESFAYYTFLDAAHPLHRALLRFSTGDEVAFERVFSWLDINLKSTNYIGNPIATNLLAWNPTNNSFAWGNDLTAPRVVRQTVNVGDRINAPTGEAGETQNYLAGHIKVSEGTSFAVGAYLDPLAGGFENANKGAIIPVNAIPGSNFLEVLWFRTNRTTAGVNAADQTKGFLPIYWPSALGRYTIQWPVNPKEIVLASKQGSEGDGPLSSERGCRRNLLSKRSHESRLQSQ